MGKQSKRTRAPAPPKVLPSMPHLFLPAAPQLFFPSMPQPVPPPLHPDLPAAIPSTYGPGKWIPPQPHQSMAASSAPNWLASPQSVAGYSSQAPWAPPACTVDDSDLQTWGLDSHPPGGFLSFFENTPSYPQDVGQGTLSQPIKVGDDTNSSDCERTEKRLLWTKEEDRRLVSAWLNNSNDPIQSNYKKNEQYWKERAGHHSY